MSAYYLLKTEPSEYSFADLQRDKVTVWDGVSNPVAVKNLRGMKPGDRLIIYETGDHKSAARLYRRCLALLEVDSGRPVTSRRMPAAAKRLVRAVPRPPVAPVMTTVSGTTARSDIEWRQ